MKPFISAGRRPSYFQWRGYLASPGRSRSRGEGRASSRTDAVCPGPPPWPGGHRHRPWQPTRRRCPERQPSWLPACSETHENRRQIINTEKGRALPAAEGGWRVLLPAALTAEVPSSSPTRRYPRWRPSAPLRLPGACSPTSAFPRRQKVAEL